MAKNSADEIKEAAEAAGIELTNEDIQNLISGGQVDAQSKARAATGLCSGFKIRDFGNGCGLYITFNGLISYCCEF